MHARAWMVEEPCCAQCWRLRRQASTAAASLCLSARSASSCTVTSMTSIVRAPKVKTSIPRLMRCSRSAKGAVNGQAWRTITKGGVIDLVCLV